MCSFFSLFVNILFDKLEVNCYVMFLDTQSNFLKCLQIFYIALCLPYLISIFFKMKKKKFSFIYKIIYLSIHYSHVGLNSESIDTILLFSKKKKLYVFSNVLNTVSINRYISFRIYLYIYIYIYIIHKKPI